MPLSTTCTEEQCQTDCKSPEPERLVGPTRPWHERDKLGNVLSLTKPHPYITTPGEVTILVFNETLRVAMPNFVSNENIFGKQEINLIQNTINTLMKNNFRSVSIRNVGKLFYFDQRNVERDPIKIQEKSDMKQVDITFEIEIVANDNNYNRTTIDIFYYNVLQPFFRLEMKNGNLQKIFSKTYMNEGISSLINSTLTLLPNASLQVNEDYDHSLDDSRICLYQTRSRLHTKIPNPFSQFCEIGCTFFFSDKNIPAKLETCTEKCDRYYSYNITVEYNDLAETARLECRDGCQIALKRCQPGYYCEQVTLLENGDDVDHLNATERKYVGGNMMYCPPGTYRDVSYDNIEQCFPCPPGRFREDIKGRDLESCSKCPVGTYANQSGNDSILDCLRCPAGRFTTEKGSGMCKCINIKACEEDQLPEPADAEKRNTVPYIGRW